ncbi:MAG: gliding motility-associated C-terminal domain-containing protein [Elusimicrobia bacterium]|nr:gliding motility-associated C-terminal domain-containing protein [Candidatus Liberimonas magnetica]
MNKFFKELIILTALLFLFVSISFTWQVNGNNDLIGMLNSGGNASTASGVYENDGSFGSFVSASVVSTYDLNSGFLPNVNNLPLSILTFPLNNSTTVTAQPTFQWDYSDADSHTQRGFLVELSTDVNFSIVNYTSGETNSANKFWQISMIDAATYYWRVKVKDDPWDEWSLRGATNKVIVITKLLDTIKSLQPSGIFLTVANNKPTISWDVPVNNVNNTICDDQSTFRVYRSTEIFTDWKMVGTVSYTGLHLYNWTDTSLTLPTNTVESSPAIPNTNVYYYKVTCVDKDGNESADSMIQDSSNDFNLISVSTDTRMIVAIPSSVSKDLYKENNPIKDNIIILSQEIPNDLDDYNILKSYDIYPAKASNLKRLPYMSFNEALVRVVWQFGDSSSVTSSSVLSHVIKNNISSNLASLYDNQFSLYWNNGNEWIKLGKDSFNGALSFRTARLGKYMVKQALKAQSFTLNKVYPTIFTPNGDNRNDCVEFQFENPKDSPVSGSIYDLRGRFVAKLKSGFNKNSLRWDGLMDSGSLATPGTYIYQIEAKGSDSKVVNGVIILAQ